MKATTPELLERIYNCYHGVDCTPKEDAMYYSVDEGEDAYCLVDIGCLIKVDLPVNLYGVRYPGHAPSEIGKIAVRKEYFFSNTQLVLSPLSRITDNDALAVAKIIIPLPFQKYTKGWIVSRKFLQEEFIESDCYITISNPKNTYSVEIDCKCCDWSLYNNGEGINNEHPMQPGRIIDFLRSKWYDMGYGDIPSLIAAGIAIDKNKIAKK